MRRKSLRCLICRICSPNWIRSSGRGRLRCASIGSCMRSLRGRSGYEKQRPPKAPTASSTMPLRAAAAATDSQPSRQRLGSQRLASRPRPNAPWRPPLAARKRRRSSRSPLSRSTYSPCTCNSPISHPVLRRRTKPRQRRGTHGCATTSTKTITKRAYNQKAPLPPSPRSTAAKLRSLRTRSRRKSSSTTAPTCAGPRVATK